ncbi:bifunctional dihydrofolate reductase-thymidylate synthase isoform X1 [Dendrobium catenatum]|nr:bifunctional dihydrofolate reductase-thymidylate synthase isoform X1 [Dendrobium catenatum]XP_028552475.1 bifunctional dihydrofolate reductase-thymidylate synthase isoform X1 [Dendrobium catenatum]
MPKSDNYPYSKERHSVVIGTFRSISSCQYCHSAAVMADKILGNIPNGIAKNDPPRTFEVVVAATREMGIGKDGKLPWKLPSDLKFFKELTMSTSDPTKKNAVIMGRRTWESIPIEKRPLPGRLNVVLTRSGSLDIATVENVVICSNMSSALDLLASSPYCFSTEKVFVIGGGHILRDVLNAPGCDAIHLTDIEASIECDTFIPAVDVSVFQPWFSSFPLVENNIRYSFVTYVRVRSQSSQSQIQYDGQATDGDSCKDKFEIQQFSFLPKMIFEQHEEYTYLRLVEDIISHGATKSGRMGIETLSKFSCQMRFNLRRSFPLLTTKRVLWSVVVEELLWFVSGSTNAKVLQSRELCLWDGNASRDFLDSVGLARREKGDSGPIYGFQWRHLGAEYIDMHTDYTGKGFDQLLDVIDKIKKKPNDRRIILSAWNPFDLKEMSRRPCQMFSQFYVENGELSCQIYESSADMGLAVPFNIASYSLLIYIIAQVCDLVPGDFTYTIGDARVYKTHVRPLREQLQRQPKPFPILKINPEKKDIDSFIAADFTLVGYDPHPEMEMKMAV